MHMLGCRDSGMRHLLSAGLAPNIAGAVPLFFHALSHDHQLARALWSFMQIQFEFLILQTWLSCGCEVARAALWRAVRPTSPDTFPVPKTMTGGHASSAAGTAQGDSNVQPALRTEGGEIRTKLGHLKSLIRRSRTVRETLTDRAEFRTDDRSRRKRKKKKRKLSKRQ